MQKENRKNTSAADATKQHFVFVYGTLMRGQRAHSFLSGADYIGEFRLDGYAMYDLGWYPGIRPRAESTVYGEVYGVDEDMLIRMDRYEGEGELYHRVLVTAESDSEKIQTFVYVYAREVTRNEIKGGKWNERF